jgi:hypothetical protein
MFSWKEIYNTTNLSEFLKVRNLLESQHIPTKIKVYSTRGKNPNMIVLGGYLLALNTAEIAVPLEAYRLLTKHAFVDHALTLIAK